MIERAGSSWVLVLSLLMGALIYELRIASQAKNTFSVLIRNESVLYKFRMSSTRAKILQEWIDAGLSKPDKSNTRLAEILGIPQSRVSEMRRGKRLLKSTELQSIADYIDEPVPDGVVTGSAALGTVPLVGFVGAGAQIFAIDDHAKGGGLEEGASSSTVAVRVRGDSMRPAYKNGDLLYYDAQSIGDLDHLIGSDCIAYLSDGRTLVKEIRKNSSGYWLHSHNADPLIDIDIEWAAKVKWVLKG